MMKRFFKDMPKDYRKKGTWKLEVIAVFWMKDSIVYSEIYTGRLWAAYLKIRFKALLKDWATAGSYYGIAYNFTEVSKKCV